MQWVKTENLYVFPNLKIKNALQCPKNQYMGENGPIQGIQHHIFSTGFLSENYKVQETSILVSFFPSMFSEEKPRVKKKIC